jgi:hypothetical protein
MGMQAHPWALSLVQMIEMCFYILREEAENAAPCFSQESAYDTLIVVT